MISKKELKRNIRIKDKYAQLIIDLGFDYDGYNDVENLKSLIDELVIYARCIIKNDDTRVIYTNEFGEEVKNILGEEIL